MVVSPGAPGSAPSSAPGKITTIIIDQPIGEVRGNQVYALMTFAQLIQRIVSYLGQPGSGGAGGPGGGGGGGGTITQSVADAAAIASFAAYGPAIEGIAAATRPPFLTGFPPNGPAGPGGAGGVVLQQGAVVADGTVEVGDLLVLTPNSLQGEIWAPLANGDPPGAIIPGIPHGFILGPTLVALPNGACVMVRIR